MRFDGKTLFVTGAGGGIGQVMCEMFAAEGGRVAAVDLDVNAAQRVADRLSARGQSAIAIEADVANEEAVAKAVAATVARFGALDCAFNNAGVELEAAATAEADLSILEKTLSVNVAGVLACMKHQITQMLRQDGGGSIVNVGSVAGLVAAAGMPSYSASKHAVVGMTKTAAVEYARRGIRVNAVCPGVVRTAMTERAVAQSPGRAERIAAIHPMNRIAEPEEVAAAALFLLSNQASFITGQALAVDGGMTVR